LSNSPGLIALIVSRLIFDEVVRHSAVLDPSTFRPAVVTVKETYDSAWIALPDHPYPADPAVFTAHPNSPRAEAANDNTSPEAAATMEADTARNRVGDHDVLIPGTATDYGLRVTIGAGVAAGRDIRVGRRGKVVGGDDNSRRVFNLGGIRFSGTGLAILIVGTLAVGGGGYGAFKALQANQVSNPTAGLMKAANTNDILAAIRQKIGPCDQLTAEKELPPGTTSQLVCRVLTKSNKDGLTLLDTNSLSFRFGLVNDLGRFQHWCKGDRRCGAADSTVIGDGFYISYSENRVANTLSKFTSADALWMNCATDFNPKGMKVVEGPEPGCRLTAAESG
jgi:hypothetical protein